MPCAKNSRIQTPKKQRPGIPSEPPSYQRRLFKRRGLSWSDPDYFSVGTLVERSSRFVLLAKMDDCTSLAALHGFTRLLQTVAPAMRKTMTYDRGSEMARHRDLATANGIQVFFADPHSPWQRGSNENANGLIREYLPKGSDLSGTSQEELNAIANRLNERPRRILGYQTPREVFAKLLAEEQLNDSIT